jgi:hypothetical protein
VIANKSISDEDMAKEKSLPISEAIALLSNNRGTPTVIAALYSNPSFSTFLGDENFMIKLSLNLNIDENICSQIVKANNGKNRKIDQNVAKHIKLSVNDARILATRNQDVVTALLTNKRVSDFINDLEFLKALARNSYCGGTACHKVITDTNIAEINEIIAGNKTLLVGDAIILAKQRGTSKVITGLLGNPNKASFNKEPDFLLAIINSKNSDVLHSIISHPICTSAIDVQVLKNVTASENTLAIIADAMRTKDPNVLHDIVTHKNCAEKAYTVIVTNPATLANDLEIIAKTTTNPDILHAIINHKNRDNTSDSAALANSNISNADREEIARRTKTSLKPK